ncbi:MAG TPA: uroporphyrinogen decarboxylase family protein, partial [Methylococcales bacterium]
MTRKSDMINALQRKKARTGDRVPIWEIEFHLWDKFSSRHMVVGREFQSLTSQEKDCALHINAEIFCEVSEKLNFTAITLPGGYWEIAVGEPAYFWLPEEARFEQIKLLQQMTSDLMLITGATGTLGIPEAGEFVEFSEKLFTAPHEIDLLAKERLKNGVESAKKLIDHGIDAVYSAADLADNRSPYYNPEQMERFILPCLAEWASKVKKMGAYAILHSDGNLMPCLEKIAFSGVDALQAIDPVAGMDMRKVKDLIGKQICLCGNIDCGLLVTACPEDVYEATKE